MMKKSKGYHLFVSDKLIYGRFRPVGGGWTGLLMLFLLLSSFVLSASCREAAKVTDEVTGSNQNDSSNSISSNKRVAQVGANLQLPCTPPDDEDILDYFTWSKNGVLLPDRSSVALQSRFIIQSDFSLMIERVTEDDEGTYTCYIQSVPPRINSYYVTVEVPASIEQQHPVPDDVDDSNSVSDTDDDRSDDEDERSGATGGGVHRLKEGGDLDLSCLAKGKPPPVITWKYQGRILDAKDSSERRIITDVVHPNQTVSSVYRIHVAQRTDSGIYVCQADNGVDLPVAAVFNVQVSYAPEITVESNWVHAGLGSFAELVCKVYSQPPAQVSWFRAGGTEDRQVLPASSGLSGGSVGSSRITTLVTEGRMKHVLRFKSVRDADLGIYTCRAENTLGRAEAAMELSGIAVAAMLRVLPPRDGNKLTMSFGPNEHHGGDNEDSKSRRVYHLIWDVVSHSPVYEYRLWLRPHGQPPATWINLIIPTSSSSSASPSSGSSLVGSASSFLHSHEYILTDLKPGVVYLVSVQSRNRFGWSSESNVLHLSGDPEDLDYHDEQQLPSKATEDQQTTVRGVVLSTTTDRTVDQTTQSAVQIIDPVSVQHHGTHEEEIQPESSTARSTLTAATTHRHNHHTSEDVGRAHHHHSHGSSSPVVSTLPSGKSGSSSLPSFTHSLIVICISCCLASLPIRFA